MTTRVVSADERRTTSRPAMTRTNNVPTLGGTTRASPYVGTVGGEVSGAYEGCDLATYLPMTTRVVSADERRTRGRTDNVLPLGSTTRASLWRRTVGGEVSGAYEDCDLWLHFFQ